MALINVKGNGEEIILHFSKETAKDEIENDLLSLKEKNASFFTGENMFFSYEGIYLTYKEEVELSSLIEKVFHGAHLKKKNILTEKEILHSLCDNETLCSVFYGSVRSGEKICARGDVLLYGDVNPGAEIEAKGNITIIGALRGNACTEKGLIFATEMMPAQIRIGKNISYNKKNENVGTCIAREENGEIILDRL